MFRCQICGEFFVDPRDPEERERRPRKFCGKWCKKRAKNRRTDAARDPEGHRWSTCLRKRRHPTQAAAQREARPRPGRDELAVYDCRYCGGWHLANYVKKPKREEGEIVITQKHAGLWQGRVSGGPEGTGIVRFRKVDALVRRLGGTKWVVSTEEESILVITVLGRPPFPGPGAPVLCQVSIPRDAAPGVRLGGGREV